MNFEQKVFKALDDLHQHILVLMGDKPFGEDINNIPYQVGLRQGQLVGIRKSQEAIKALLAEAKDKDKDL